MIRDRSPSGNQNNLNAGSNTGITLNADAQISAESSVKKQQPNANSLADGYSLVNENSQPSTSGTSSDDPSPVIETSQPSASGTSCEYS